MITAANKFNFQFREEFNKLIHTMMSSKTFTAVGLELASVNTYFDTNEEFPLKELTFAFFNYEKRELHVNIEHDFFKKESKAIMLRAKLLFILLHEVHHKILLHFTRENGRKPDVFNMAADYEIHNLIYDYSFFESPLKDDLNNIRIMLESWDTTIPMKNDEFRGCFSKKYLQNTAEEIYDLLLEKNIESKTHGPNGNEKDPDESNQDVIESTLKDDNGNPIAKTFNSDMNNIKENQEEINDAKLGNQLSKKEIIDKSNQKGNGSSEMQRFFKKLFKVKVDWEKILKSSIQTEMSPQDYYSWRRPRNISSILDMYLPAIEEDVSKYGTLIVALDESGSMTDDDVCKAFAVIKSAKEYYKQIILLEHDTKIVKETKMEEFSDEDAENLLQRHACGGTSHKCVFEYIKNYNEKNGSDPSNMISCAICISDLYSDIPEYQNLVPAAVPLIYIANVEQEEIDTRIKGKVIAIK